LLSSNDLGFRKLGEENGWQCYGVGDEKPGQYVEVRAMPEARRGACGTSSIYHLA
jgi:hypothetical protein